jgi:hypothetical protein
VFAEQNIVALLVKAADPEKVTVHVVPLTIEQVPFAMCSVLDVSRLPLALYTSGKDCAAGDGRADAGMFVRPAPDPIYLTAEMQPVQDGAGVPTPRENPICTCPVADGAGVATPSDIPITACPVTVGAGVPTPSAAIGNDDGNAEAGMFVKPAPDPMNSEAVTGPAKVGASVVAIVGAGALPVTMIFDPGVIPVKIPVMQFTTAVKLAFT